MIFVCPVCGKSCKNAGGLNLHMMNTHPDWTSENKKHWKQRNTQYQKVCPDCGSKNVRDLSPLNDNDLPYIERGHKHVCNKCQEVFS